MSDFSDFYCPSIYDNEQIRKAFVKDMRFQIQVVKSPIFEHLLDLYERCFKIEGRPSPKVAWKRFCSSVEKYPSVKAYFDYRDRLFVQILETVRQTPGYQRLAEDTMDKYAIKTKYPRPEIYQAKYVGQHLYSIDLRQANFMAMKEYSPDIVLNTDNYDQFIRKFTDDEHLIQSRIFRQLIFGNLLPNKQAIIQKYLIQKEMEKIPEEMEVLGATNDEMILRDLPDSALKVLDHSCVHLTSIIMDQVVLKKPRKGKEIFFTYVERYNPETQSFEFSRYELRCLPGNIAPQIYRQIYLNEDIEDDDRWSYSEEYLCHVVPVKVLSKHLLKHIPEFED